jgi:CDP-diacylglycerol--glycerol-3-phosphate 3-phosphatidyltransferase
MTVYSLKPRFQSLLRPMVGSLASLGVTANQVTLSGAVLSIALGTALAMCADRRTPFLVLPVFLLLRMALNAIDGMLAREFGQKSNLGAFLNELADVVSDLFLYLPFAFLPHFQPLWVAVVIVLAVISEMAGTVAVMTGASRRYDGPFGKSDRAVAFAALGLLVGLGVPPSPWLRCVFPAFAILSATTIVNRVRKGLAEVAPR